MSRQRTTLLTQLPEEQAPLSPISFGDSAPADFDKHRRTVEHPKKLRPFEENDKTALQFVPGLSAVFQHKVGDKMGDSLKH